MLEKHKAVYLSRNSLPFFRICVRIKIELDNHVNERLNLDNQCNQAITIKFKGAALLKYIEFGVGNTWLVRTEFECDDGHEFEVKGVSGTINFHSIYFRIWIGKTVFIIDSKDGFKRVRKSSRKLKLIMGIVSR